MLLPHAPLDVRLPTLLLFALSLAGAWLITFFADYLLGMLGFWTSQSIAFVQAFFVLRMLFSGVLAPLAMFPSGIHAALQWLPFRYMLSFPVEVLTGRWVHPDLLHGFVVQWLWAGALLLATVLLWRRAMRAYGAVGA